MTQKLDEHACKFTVEPQNWTAKPIVLSIDKKTPFEKLIDMANDPRMRSLARDEGIDIQTISKEQYADLKDSFSGPYISDMTLQARDKNGRYARMPIIRRENFADYFQGVDLNSILVWTNNQNDADILEQKTLRTYLELLSQNEGFEGSLLTATDRVAVHTVQACFLPANAIY
jgi:hypothetical protein